MIKDCQRKLRRVRRYGKGAGQAKEFQGSIPISEMGKFVLPEADRLAFKSFRIAGDLNVRGNHGGR